MVHDLFLPVSNICSLPARKKKVAPIHLQTLSCLSQDFNITVFRIEHSAANLADSIQQGGLPVKAGSIAPSLIEACIQLIVFPFFVCLSFP